MSGVGSLGIERSWPWHHAQQHYGALHCVASGGADSLGIERSCRGISYYCFVVHGIVFAVMGLRGAAISYYCFVVPCIVLQQCIQWLGSHAISYYCYAVHCIGTVAWGSHGSVAWEAMPSPTIAWWCIALGRCIGTMGVVQLCGAAGGDFMAWTLVKTIKLT